MAAASQWPVMKFKRFFLVDGQSESYWLYVGLLLTNALVGSLKGGIQGTKGFVKQVNATGSSSET